MKEEKEQEKIYSKKDKFEKHRKILKNNGSPNPVMGILLIFLGTTFLLNNLNIIPWSVWDHLLKFWPILLILGGIQILLGTSVFANFILFIISVVVFVSIWTKALLIIESNIVIALGLNKLPWFNLLQSLNINI